MKKICKKAIVLVLALMAAFCLAAFPAAAAEEQGGNLVITVVEDIPAEDIDDSAVPLAAPGSRANEIGQRLVLIAGIIFVCALIFVAIMIVREKRLAKAAFASVGAAPPVNEEEAQ